MNGYVCAKCSNQNYETEQIKVTGGTLSKMFDVQNKTYHAITCTNCGYTEFYKAQTSMLENIADLFLGG